MLDESHFFSNIAKEPANPPSDFTALCLAVHMHGAIAVDPQSKLHLHFHHCARNLLEQLEIDGRKMGLATVQAWILISFYKFRQLSFSEAWISSGRASRLAQMMGLHRLDADESQRMDIGSSPPAAGDDTRRRLAFALVFILDRFTSISTGLPMAITEKKVLQPNDWTLCKQCRWLIVSRSPPGSQPLMRIIPIHHSLLSSILVGALKEISNSPFYLL